MQRGQNTNTKHTQTHTGTQIKSIQEKTTQHFGNWSSPEDGSRTSRTIRKNKREYLKGKINEHETKNKNKNIRDLYRGINEFEKGYQPRINIINDENANLLADPQGVLNKWKLFFNQVLNVHGLHDSRQMDIHTAEPLVPEPSLVEVEIAIGKLKNYKSWGTA
jgi:hypothetical protein